jgi:hypothetical protein
MIYKNVSQVLLQVCNKSNTRGVTSGAGPVYPSGAHEFTPGYSGVRVAQSFVFCVVLCRSAFVLMSFSLHLTIA